MLRAALVALGAATIATGAIAQPTGNDIPKECDDFLKKYEICLETKIPAELRSVNKQGIDQLRKNYDTIAKSGAPNAKSLLEMTCKHTEQQLKASLEKAYGCAF
jgi:hypothetical protein